MRTITNTELKTAIIAHLEAGTLLALHGVSAELMKKRDGKDCRCAIGAAMTLAEIEEALHVVDATTPEEINRCEIVAFGRGATQAMAEHDFWAAEFNRPDAALARAKFLATVHALDPAIPMPAAWTP